MKTHNLMNNLSLKKLEKNWVAFDSSNNIIAHAKTYSDLYKLIPGKMIHKVQTTYINSSNAFLAP